MGFQWGDFSLKAVQSLTSDARINIWEGAVRSGKTVSSLAAWINYTANAPDGPLLMCGKTLRTLKHNILDLLTQMAGNRFKFSMSKGEGELCGRKIYLCGANDSRAQGHIRGLTLAGAYGDELTLWPQDFFQMLLSRLSIEGARFYGTTNPDSSSHWLLTEYLQKDGLDLKRWHFKLTDNPNLPKKYVESIKKEYSGLWYKRFIEGEWCAAQGVIYDRFDRTKHVLDIADNIKYDRIFCAADYGIMNPCVFGMIGVYKQNNQIKYHLIKEYYHSGRTARQKTDIDYAEDFNIFCGGIKPEYIIIDPSASSLITLLRQKGYRVIPAKNDVMSGIQYVSALLVKAKLSISPLCINTIREFESYCWDTKAAALGEDKPLKTDDHCMDMLRYGVYTDNKLTNSQRDNNFNKRYR